MVELLRPEIVDVQGKQREYKRIEQAKRLVPLQLCGLATKTKTSVMIGARTNPHERSREALLFEKNEKARSEQKTHDADDTEQQYVVSHDIEHIADESAAALIRYWWSNVLRFFSVHMTTLRIGQPKRPSSREGL